MLRMHTFHEWWWGELSSQSLSWFGFICVFFSCYDDRMKPGEIRVRGWYRLYIYIWKGTFWNSGISSVFPTRPRKTHSSVWHPFLRSCGTVTLQSFRQMLIPHCSSAARPPPIRLSYHKSEQFKVQCWFVNCAPCWSVRRSQSYKAQGLLIHDLLRKISWESRLYLHYTAVRVMRSELQPCSLMCLRVWLK